MYSLFDMSINDIKKEIFLYESQEERPKDLKITQIVIDPYTQEYINKGDFCVMFQATLRKAHVEIVRMYEWNADKMKITLGSDVAVTPLSHKTNVLN